MSAVLIVLIVFGSIVAMLWMILYRPAAFRKYREKKNSEDGKLSRAELEAQIDKLERRIDYLNAVLEEEKRKR